MDDNSKYYHSRHFQRLLHRYEKAISEGHVPYLEADELTDIAEYYMTGKQDAKANQAIKAAIDMHPDSVDPQIFLARQRMFYGKLDEARNIIDGITEQNDCEVIYIRAELLIKEGRPDEASDFLQNQMSLMQDSLDTYLYECTSIFMDYDKWQLAEEWLGRLKEAYPTHPRLSIMEAEIKMGLDDFNTAHTMLKRILDEDPYNYEAWDLLAETDIALEKIPEAQEAADYSLAINPQDSTALLMKANAFYHDGLMPEAIEYYTKYLDLQPDDLSIQLSLALCYCSEERFKEVLPILEKAEQYALKLPDKKDDLSQVLQLRAFALSRLNRIADAITLVEKAREYCDESQAWRCDMTLGDIYLQAKDTKQAENCFAKALEKSSEQGDTLFNIALAYSNAGYNDVAIDLLDDVWTIFGPKEGQFVVPYLANCYLRKNDMVNFLFYLKMAPSCDRETTKALFHDRYPGLEPEDYYLKALQDWGNTSFPTNDTDADLAY